MLDISANFIYILPYLQKELLQLQTDPCILPQFSIFKKSKSFLYHFISKLFVKNKLFSVEYLTQKNNTTV